MRARETQSNASLARLVAGCGAFVAVVVTVLLAPLVTASACPAMTGGGSGECTTTSFSLAGLATDLWRWLGVVLPVVAVTTGATIWLRRLERRPASAG